MTAAARLAGWSVALLALAQPVCASAQSALVLGPELWDRPRSAQAVMEQAAVRQAVAAWLAQPAARLVVRHGPGPEAYAQAEELRTWLSALAIEGERVLLRGDPAASALLRLEVVAD